VLPAALSVYHHAAGPLIMSSSPYSKRGVLWDNYRKHYGPQGAPLILVAKGTTRDFNATIPQEEIQRELERDRVRNTAELLAEFRTDLETYIDIAVVEGCVGGHREMLPATGPFYSVPALARIPYVRRGPQDERWRDHH